MCDAERRGLPRAFGRRQPLGAAAATHDGIAATVIVGLMSTYEDLLDHNVFATPGCSSRTAGRATATGPTWPPAARPRRCWCSTTTRMTLFTPAGMRAAHERLTRIMPARADPQAYTGQFYPGPHKFDLEMQAAAFGG